MLVTLCLFGPARVDLYSSARTACGSNNLLMPFFNLPIRLCSVPCLTMGADIYSPEQVSTHNDAADLWITIDQEVYDLSNFIEEHPGGANSVFKGRLSYLVVF